MKSKRKYRCFVCVQDYPKDGVFRADWHPHIDGRFYICRECDKRNQRKPVVDQSPVLLAAVALRVRREKDAQRTRLMHNQESLLKLKASKQ